MRVKGKGGETLKEDWRIKNGKKYGKIESERRKKATRKVAPLLKRWIKENGEQKICPICGENMPQTFHVHHIDGNHKNNSDKNRINICASCHAITYKAKNQLRELWMKRHDRLVVRRKNAIKAWKTRKGLNKGRIARL